MSKRALVSALAVTVILMVNLPGGGSAGTRPVGRTRPAAGTGPWKVVKDREYVIAVPKGWRTLPLAVKPYVLYLNGDGLGAPAMDETGSPIQIGMTLERWGKTKGTAMEGAKVSAARRNPRLQPLQKTEVKPLKIADGTEVAFLRAFFRKDGRRKSLQMKLYAKDANGTGWVVSAWIVTGLKSKFIDSNEPLVKALRAHMTSLCFDEARFSTAALAAAYGISQTQPSTRSRPATAPARK